MVKRFGNAGLIKNVIRNSIIELCKTPRSATELQNKLQLTTGALYHHLNILTGEGIIIKEYAKGENGKAKRGNETILRTNTRLLKEIEQKEEKRLNSLVKEFDKKNQPKMEFLRLKILKMVKDKDIEVQDIFNSFDEDAQENLNEILNNGENKGYFGTYVKIEDKGRDKLKKINPRD